MSLKDILANTGLALGVVVQLWCLAWLVRVRIEHQRALRRLRASTERLSRHIDVAWTDEGAN